MAAALEQRGLETYLPLTPRVSQWHDRKKTVHWPLFPGYVFVRFEPEEASAVLSVPGSVQVIGVGGRPASISDADIENVKRFAACLAETGSVPKPVPLIEEGQKVIVRSGPFSGVRGQVLERRAADRVLIQVGLTTIGQALKIEVGAGDVEPAAAGMRGRAS